MLALPDNVDKVAVGLERVEVEALDLGVIHSEVHFSLEENLSIFYGILSRMIGQNVKNQRYLRTLMDLHLRVSKGYIDRREKDNKILDDLPYDAVAEMQTIQSKLSKLEKEHKSRRFWQFNKKARNLSAMKELNERLHSLQADAKKEQADVNNFLVKIVERELKIIYNLLDDTDKIIQNIEHGSAEQKVAKHVMARGVELYDNIAEDNEEMITKKVHNMEDQWLEYMTYLETKRKNSTRRVKRGPWRP